MLKNNEGQKVPNVTFKTRQNNEWKDVTTDDLFKGKNVVVFSLPGAFTPTCSGSHVPRFNDLTDSLKGCGVDSIVCMSVNDGFVMSEWQKDQNAENITFIPDGNAEFTEQMGMLVDKTAIGFGKRSWRYSMLVKDGVIDKMFIEPEVDGDPFEVSDADTMLNYLNPEATKPEYITMFSKKGCQYCEKAKNLLNEHNLKFEEIELNKDITSRTLLAVSGAKTTPQIFIGGKLIGGSEDLEAYLKK
ncbi:glutathione peroxidase [bacterium]|nr:MAG: glutathione peroxidase [bacterium]